MSRPEARDALAALVDSLTKAFTRRVVQEVSRKQARDSLEALVGGLARTFVLNATTGAAKDSLNELTRELVSTIGDTLQEKVLTIGDSLFPPSTRRSIDSIAANLAKLTRPQTLSFIKKSAEELLGTAIAGLIILALVIGFFFIRSRRNRQMFDVVSETIDELDADKREELAKRIEEKATRVGVQPYLRKALKERRSQQRDAGEASSSEDN